MAENKIKLNALKKEMGIQKEQPAPKNEMNELIQTGIQAYLQSRRNEELEEPEYIEPEPDLKDIVIDKLIETAQNNPEMVQGVINRFTKQQEVKNEEFPTQS